MIGRQLVVTLLAVGLLGGGCATVRPNQVGVKQTLGRLKDDVKGPGPVAINPFVTKVVKIQVATANLAIEEDLPSREGLTVRSESSTGPASRRPKRASSSRASGSR